LLAITGSIMAITASILLTPAGLLALYALLLVALGLFLRVRTKRGRPFVRRREDPLVWVFGVAGLPLLLSATTNSTPWLPPETITTKDASVVGYVTASDSRWTKVLLYEPRIVQILETSAITSRAMCKLKPNPLNAPLAEFTHP